MAYAGGIYKGDLSCCCHCGRGVDQQTRGWYICPSCRERAEPVDLDCGTSVVVGYRIDGDDYVDRYIPMPGGGWY